MVPPLVQSATFFGGGPDHFGELRYSRYGNNPNQIRVGVRVARLEEMESGLALGSGMAAISLTLLSLLEVGDHLVASHHLYGTTRLFMDEELPRRGVEVDYVDPDDPGGWDEALRAGTRLLYLETPTNPTLRVFDPRPVARVARRAGVPLVMDATFATPVNLRAGGLGADIVIHSATKYLAGHSDVVAGVVVGPETRIAAVRGLLHLYGPTLDPHAAWLLERGLRTLGVRMERHNSNALALARWFGARGEVERVIHPGLPDHPDHELCRSMMGGGGGMLGVILRGGRRAADRFCRRLRLAAVAPSLGGVETLVSQPRLTSHRSMPTPERERLGIPDGFVRISVGIEGLEDLKADFEQALVTAEADG